MEAAAAAHAANLQALKTWIGHAEVRTLHQEMKSGYGVYEQTASVDFAWDHTRDAWWFRREVTSSSRTQHGVDHPGVFDGAITGGMLKNGVYHSVFPSVPGKDGAVQSVSVAPVGAPPAIGDLTEVLQPEWFFGLGDVSFAERVGRLRASAAANPPWFQLAIQDGPEGSVIVQYGNSNLSTASKRIVLESPKSGNIVEQFGRDDDREVTRHRTYEQINGVFVPRTFEYSNKTHDGDFVATRSIRFTRNVVNEPVPEEQFNLEQIGVKPGARVSDQRLGQTSVFKQDEYRAALGRIAPSPPPPQVLPAPRADYWRWIVVGNLLVLAVIALFVYRARRPHPPKP